MLEALNDPYTRYLDPRAFQDENDAIDARIVGIGINLQQSKDQQHLIVTRTIEAGPAETVGVRAGDEIVGIDGTSAIGMTPEQAADRIRGKAGTAVQLSLQATKGNRSLCAQCQHHPPGNHHPRSFDQNARQKHRLHLAFYLYFQ